VAQVKMDIVVVLSLQNLMDKFRLATVRTSATLRNTPNTISIPPQKPAYYLSQHFIKRSPRRLRPHVAN
jgi:hypothetical protein